MPAVEVDHLVVRYGNLVAVDGVSFDADFGEVVALLGPNGAGKTTTVETLEGFRHPDSGTARVLGLDPWSAHSRLTARVGVVLQRGGVYPIMNAERAVRLFAAYYEDPRDPDELIDLVGLRSVAAHGVQTPVGWGTAAAGARSGTHRQAPCRLLGRADGGRRPGRPYRGARRCRRSATRRGVRDSHEPRGSTRWNALPTG